MSSIFLSGNRAEGSRDIIKYIARSYCLLLFFTHLAYGIYIATAGPYWSIVLRLKQQDILLIIILSFFFDTLIHPLASILADNMGRKRSVVGGLSISTLSFLFYLSIWAFKTDRIYTIVLIIASEFTLSLGIGLRKDPLNAWMIDSLRSHGDSDTDRVLCWGQILQILAWFFGAIALYVMEKYFWVPWLIAIIFHLITICISIVLMKETYPHTRSEGEKKHLGIKMYRTIYDAILFIKNNKTIFWLTMSYTLWGFLSYFLAIPGKGLQKNIHHKNIKKYSSSSNFMGCHVCITFYWALYWL